MCTTFPLSDPFLLKDLVFQINRSISIFLSFAGLNSCNKREHTDEKRFKNGVAVMFAENLNSYEI